MEKERGTWKKIHKYRNENTAFSEINMEHGNGSKGRWNKKQAWIWEENRWNPETKIKPRNKHETQNKHRIQKQSLDKKLNRWKQARKTEMRKYEVWLLNNETGDGIQS